LVRHVLMRGLAELWWGPLSVVYIRRADMMLQSEVYLSEGYEA